jgi:hypothetical protein
LGSAEEDTASNPGDNQQCDEAYETLFFLVIRHAAVGGV